jgi:hypothetical protein
MKKKPSINVMEIAEEMCAVQGHTMSMEIAVPLELQAENGLDHDMRREIVQVLAAHAEAWIATRCSIYETLVALPVNSVRVKLTVEPQG